MKITSTKLALGLSLAILAANTTFVSRADDDKAALGEATAQEKTLSNTLMEATKNQDYKAFVAEGDPDFKSLPKSEFKSVCKQVSSRLKAGYHVVFLGGAKKTGAHMTIWKIVYDDNGEEDILQLVVSDGKVAGALLQ